MLRTHYSNEITEKLEGKQVVVGGWVKVIREHGKIKFLIIKDSGGDCQITIKEGESPKQVTDTLKNLGKEFVVLVEGKVKTNKQAPGGVEIIPSRINILSKAETPLPLDMKIKSGLDKRLDWRSVDLRKPEVAAIFKIQSKLVEGMEAFLRNSGFVQVFTPCIIGAASEGGADVFPVVYFHHEAFLRQDPQLHRELLIAGGFDRIFDLGPSWRAEPHHTTRHMCEHRGCAIELAFISDETDTMHVEEDLVIAAFKQVESDCKAELELLGKQVIIPKKPFPELRFPEIYDILAKLGSKLEFGGDYGREDEKLLGDYVKKKYKHEFYFVNRFPFKTKPFYVMRVDDDPQWARSVDMMFKGLEMSSGGQREHRYDKIVQQVKEKKMSLASVKWFTEFFRYGAPPMGGFNIGIERLTQMLLDLENVREATLFPRAPERLMP